MSERQTHDFSRTMRTECCISDVVDGGQRLKLYGWSYKSLRDGDFVILASGGRTSRYQLESVRRPGEPLDQWFGEATFAPRGKA